MQLEVFMRSKVGWNINEMMANIESRFLWGLISCCGPQKINTISCSLASDCKIKSNVYSSSDEKN